MAPTVIWKPDARVPADTDGLVPKPLKPPPPGALNEYRSVADATFGMVIIPPASTPVDGTPILSVPDVPLTKINLPAPVPDTPIVNAVCKFAVPSLLTKNTFAAELLTKNGCELEDVSAPSICQESLRALRRRRQ